MTSTLVPGIELVRVSEERRRDRFLGTSFGYDVDVMFDRRFLLLFLLFGLVEIASELVYWNYWRITH